MTSFFLVPQDQNRHTNQLEALENRLTGLIFLNRTFVFDHKGIASH